MSTPVPDAPAAGGAASAAGPGAAAGAHVAVPAPAARAVAPSAPGTTAAGAVAPAAAGTTADGAAPVASDLTAGGQPAAGDPLIPRGLVVLLGAAAAVVVAAGMRQLAWLIGPLFLALVVVITMAPVQWRLRDRGWPRWGVTLALVAVGYVAVLSPALGVGIALARLATALPRYAPDGAALAADGAALLSRLGVGPDELRAMVDGLDLRKLAQALGAVLADVAGLVTNLVFVLALLLFLSVEASSIGTRLGIISADRPAAAQALRRFARDTRQHMLVSTVFGLVVAALDTVALAIIGIPLPVVWGVLAFVATYVPNIGLLIGLVPPALLGLLAGGPWTALLVVGVYCVIHVVVRSLVGPRHLGLAGGLAGAVTFLSLVFWTWLIGPLGAILAVPLTLLAKALLVDIDPRARWADALLRAHRPSAPQPADLAVPVGSRPWSTP